MRAKIFGQLKAYEEIVWTVHNIYQINILQLARRKKNLEH